MLNVTPGACERLTRKLARRSAGEDQAMRFTRKPGGWKLSRQQTYYLETSGLGRKD